ncbi:hypothetical protein TNCV_903411 [Trichonephila clavipes]|nr:hypothetical protein TNCV_903411 [Trichonephila clavipes]
MNSPDYNDLLFNLSTSPSTPVASHDGTQTMVSLEPLRPPVKKIDSQRRSRRFPQAQVFLHTQSLAVLRLRDHGFTFTNGAVSYAMHRVCPNQLFPSLHYLNVGTICVTDQRSKNEFKVIQACWSS